jgi:hypothetical protein
MSTRRRTSSAAAAGTCAVFCGRANFDDEVAALNEAHLTQTSAKAVDERGRWRSDAQEANAPDLARLLCQTSKRPRGCRRAADERDELAPF